MCNILKTHYYFTLFLKYKNKDIEILKYKNISHKLFYFILFYLKGAVEYGQVLVKQYLVTKFRKYNHHN